jgi:hypothetical protein
MRLKEVLENLVRNNTPVLLNDGQSEWEASVLLETLPETKLKRDAYMQPGLYIAEINHGGYLGQVLYKMKLKGS